MSNLNKSELEDAYTNMQNIITKQEKEIEDLKQEIVDNKDEYKKNYYKLKEKYNVEIELLSGVELENSQVVESKSENAILLKSIRTLIDRVPPKYKNMYNNFENIVVKDIKNKKTHTSLSIKQRNVIEIGLEHQKITSIN